MPIKPINTCASFGLERSPMSWNPALNESVMTVNGQTYTDCDISFSIDHDLRHAFKTNYDITIKPRGKQFEVFAPLFIDYKDTGKYRHDLFAHLLHALRHRLEHQFPGWTAYIYGESPDGLDENTAYEVSIKLVNNKQKQEIELAPALHFVWMRDELLHTFVQGHIDRIRRREEEEERHRIKNLEDDPLFSFKEKMARIGYVFDWNLAVSQYKDKEKDIDVGDTLISVRCPGLYVFDPYVLIGPLYKLRWLSDEELKQTILLCHGKAIDRYNSKEK